MSERAGCETTPIRRILPRFGVWKNLLVTHLYAEMKIQIQCKRLDKADLVLSNIAKKKLLQMVVNLYKIRFMSCLLEFFLVSFSKNLAENFLMGWDLFKFIRPLFVLRQIASSSSLAMLSQKGRFCSSIIFTLIPSLYKNDA